MKSLVWLHPLLFALTPVAFLYANNTGIVSYVEIVRPLIVLIAAVGIMLLLLRFIFRDVTKGAVLLSLIIVLFFVYGHIHSLLPDFRINIGGFVLYPNTVLLPAWSFVVAVGSFFIIRMKRELGILSQNLNFVAMAMISVSILNGAVSAMLSGKETVELSEIDISVVDDKSLLPDIYFIILDGYAGNDILAERFDFDNSEFTNALRERGFNVIDSSRSNYCQTILSLSSTLNMRHHNQTVVTLGEESEDRKALIDLIKNNRVTRNLRHAGYTFAALSSGYYGTEMTNADVYVTQRGALSEFEEILLNTTPIPVLMKKMNSLKLHTARIKYNLKKLESGLKRNIADKSPLFVFAHFICPHPPFVFNAEGVDISSGSVQIFAHGKNGIWPSEEKDRQGYIDQIQFMNKSILNAVDSILTHSEQPPVIIVQGDHGSLFPSEPGDSSDLFYREKLSILSALYLPGVDSSLIHERLSPVNNFRLIFNEYLGSDLPLLADKSFYSTWQKPLNFTPVER